MRGKKPALNRRQVAHARFCAAMRWRILVKLTGRKPPATLHHRASAQATAARLRVSSRVARRYVLGLEVPLEDWLAGRRGLGPETHGVRERQLQLPYPAT